MAKKKKVVKVKKSKKVVKKAKKVAKTAKKAKKTLAKSKVSASPAVKIVGEVEHFFGHISVAAFKVKHPIKIGDTLRFKGHTTDFTQRIDSMQINHQDVVKANKGEDIGLKVKDKVRVGDLITLEPEAKAFTAPEKTESSSISTLSLFKKQTPRPEIKKAHPPIQPRQQPPVFPQAKTEPPAVKPPLVPPKKSDPYSNTKFFKF